MKLRLPPIQIVFACGVALLAGCNKKPVVDGSSEEAFKKSVEELKEGLSDSDREELEQATMTIALDGVNLLEMAADGEGAKRHVRDKLDGMSADEILSEAEKIRSSREEKQNTQILDEIRELEERQERVRAEEEKLKAFAVARSRFYFDDSGFSTQPTIELSVQNNTDTAISRAYFHGVLATPGRAVPWLSDDFNYEIRGGLEPGESATWKLAPNMFGEWSKVPRDRSDMVLTVSVKRLDGPDGKAFIDAEFPEHDLQRLDQLRAMIDK